VSESPVWECNQFLPQSATRLSDAIHQLAVALPGAAAAEDATEAITFVEFERRTNQVANRILAAYPSTGDGPVALVFGHGVSPFVTAVGALVGGFAVAPFDAREPRDRLVELVDRSRASLVVTDPQHAAIARAVGAGRPVLVLDEATISAALVTEPPAEISPDTPGFLFFTSGSTGAAKGVLSAHHHVVPRYVSFGNDQGYAPGDRVAVTASFGFSLAHTYFLSAILSGATACCYDLKYRGMSRLPEWIGGNGITVVTFVPSVLRALPPSAHRMESVRLVNLGGETVYGHDVRRARPLFGRGTTFTNVMGSAEAGIVATYVIPPEQAEDAPVPCGSIAPGVEVRVVDPETGEAVSPGAAGRLVVVREHLSLRYWRDPDLTAELYFAERDGRQGFRTSDLVRFRDDGLLEHLGRLDPRVKVRGAMVSPAEIEAALLASGMIADAVVAATPGDDGHTHLVAYVVPEASETVSLWQLRRALAEQLPLAALPRSIVLLDAIPRTTRDKVDRNALPPATPVVVPPYRSGSGLQRDLCALFAEILSVERVGLDDDFFDLGGDSLGVVELMAAIGDRFGIEVPASLILDAPTVAELAPRLTHRRGFRAPTVVPLRDGIGPPFFCFTGGGAPVISLRALSETVERPFYGVQPRGLEERALPDHSVTAAAQRALKGVRAAQPMGPYLVGGYSFGGLVAFETACRLVALGETVGLLVILDVPAPGHCPTRNERLRARADALLHDPHAGSRPSMPVVAARALRFATRSAADHAQRGVTLGSAGLIPRRGLAQYELFFQLNHGMGRKYQPTTVLNAPALVVRTDGDGSSHRETTRDLGWSRWISGRITVVDVAGDHLGLLRHPTVLRVGSHLRNALDQAL
jgi:acyl-coenzyme A synthetase/AMP-(fatty) acid ligase/thioesterase domain-containing protein/acyl carrier protein